MKMNLRLALRAVCPLASWLALAVAASAATAPGTAGTATTRGTTGAATAPPPARTATAVLATATPTPTPDPAPPPNPHAPKLLTEVTPVIEQQAELVETVPVESGLGFPMLRSAHEVWVEAIRTARWRLDLAEFYFSDWPGEPLQDVVREIVRAGQRGVRVRILLDARMHRTYPMPADSLAKLLNIEVRELDMSKYGGGVLHAKYFVVDERRVFLGSQNLDWRALKHIHELGVWIAEMRTARVFQDLFEQDWERGEPNPRPDPARLRSGVTDQPWYRFPFRMVPTPGDTLALMPSYSPRGLLPDSTLWDRDAIERMLDAADEEIVLQLLTYSTAGRGQSDSTLDEALRRAAERGVKVKMLISDWGTGPREIEALKSLARVPNIEVRISTVPQWSGGYIPFARVEHCKYVVADSVWTWVGTSNWEPDYFHRSRNVAVTLKSVRLALQAREVFRRSWDAPGAVPLDLAKEYKVPEHGETPPPGMKKYGG
ncbi:MAG: hypothetical protein HZB25_03450 [Candidatus Eisenbacteria bacterium]|nr:hypothetical protein [Candidatus Eisenbacteria bacterium]